MRRPSGASGGGDFFSVSEGAIEAGFVPAGAARGKSAIFASWFPSVAGDSRSGATDLITVVQSTRSSRERTRRRFPSWEFMESRARPGHRRWHAPRRPPGRPCGSGNGHLRSRLRQRDIRSRYRRPTHSHALRHQHDELPVLLDAAGNVADFLAVRRNRYRRAPDRRWQSRCPARISRRRNLVSGFSLSIGNSASIQTGVP